MEKHSKKIALLMGSLSVLALPPFYIFPILLVSFSTLLLLLGKSKKHDFALGYWFGFGFFSFGLIWVGNALLIDAATFGWLYVLVFLGSGLFFGLFTAIPAFLSYFNKNIIAKALSFCAYMVIFEWLRSWILTGFPWNLWGSTLAFKVEFLQLASLIGVYGLSLVVIVLALCPAIFIEGYKKTAVIVFVALMVLVSGFGSYRVEKLKSDELSDVKIRVVQPSIPQEMKWSRELLESNFQKHIDMSREKGLDDVDMVIWGETASAFALDLDEEHLNQIVPAIPENGYLLTGLVRYEFSRNGDYQPLNSSFVIDDKGEIVSYYDKAHLVPFGEYIPLRSWMPGWIKPVTNTIANFKPGDGHKVISLGKVPPFGVLICYEIIFAHQVVDEAKRPEWIVNITNDGWYGDSSGPRQHLVATQLRAVEEGLTIVRVANSGVSAVINRYGKIMDKIDLNKEAILDFYLPLELSSQTFYAKFGNVVPLALCMFNILCAFLWTIIGRKPSKMLTKQYINKL